MSQHNEQRWEPFDHFPISREPDTFGNPSPKDNAVQQEKLKKFIDRLGGQGGGPQVKQFPSGATRTTDEGKNDYEAFISPAVLEFFGDYMTRHRRQVDGSVRDSDNWQKGIPLESYKKALIRHVFELWSLWRGTIPARVKREMPGATRHEAFLETAGAVMFNIQGLIFEYLRSDQLVDEPKAQPGPGIHVPAGFGQGGLSQRIADTKAYYENMRNQAAPNAA